MVLYCSLDYQTSFKSTGLSVREKKFNIDFQDGGHLGFPIRMNLSTSRYFQCSFKSIGLLVQDKIVQNRFSTRLLHFRSE